MIGDISIFPRREDVIVEWKINDFFSLSEKDLYYWSPRFSFGGETWYLGMFPNGWSESGSSGHVDLDLWINFSSSSIRQAFSLSLKTVKGEKENEKYCTQLFDGWDHQGFRRFIPRSELSRRRYELLPDGVLTVVCTMKTTTSTGSATKFFVFRVNDNTVSMVGNTASACCHYKRSFDAESQSSHQRKCPHRPVKCPDCLEIVVLQKWLEEHECEKENPEEGKKERKKILKRKQKKRKKILNKENFNKANSEHTDVDASTQTGEEDAVGKLLQDLKRIMVSGDFSDVTISVRGEEIRLHGSILRSRNHFLDSRPNNESQETIPDALTIDDCDPDQFCILIHYIYTGTVDKMCPENVCGLYDVAVTCQEQQMKAECLQLMMNTLSVDNFCDYTALALKHDQEELLQKATELFVRKAKQITHHKTWEAFLERYPAQANKLYMKALDQYDEK